MPVKKLSTFGYVYEVGNRVDDGDSEVIYSSNGWKLAYFFSNDRIKNVTLGVEGNSVEKGYTGVITNDWGELVAVFFFYRKVYAKNYLAYLSGGFVPGAVE